MIVNWITKTQIKESYGTKMPSNSSVTQQKGLEECEERKGENTISNSSPYFPRMT